MPSRSSIRPSASRRPESGSSSPPSTPRIRSCAPSRRSRRSCRWPPGRSADRRRGRLSRG